MADEQKRFVSFQAPDAIVDLLTTAARQAGISRSELIRRAATRAGIRVVEQAAGLKPDDIREEQGPR